MQTTKSHFSKSSSNTVPLPTPILAAKPTLVGSWHMLEQSANYYSRIHGQKADKERQLHWKCGPKYRI